MTNLTLADFYNPTIASVSTGVMHLVFILQIFMFPFILYAILKKSKMGMYRWYLITTITANTLVISSFFLASPVFLGVYFMVLIDSPIESWLSIGSWYTVIDFGVFFVFITDCGITICILYRYISENCMHSKGAYTLISRV
jgi:hypothetical protein